MVYLYNIKLEEDHIIGVTNQLFEYNKNLGIIQDDLSILLDKIGSYVEDTRLFAKET